MSQHRTFGPLHKQRYPLAASAVKEFIGRIENVDNEIEMETLKEGIAAVEVQAYKKRQTLI